MGTISTTGRAVFRDYVTDGVPSSGPQSPVKADIRTWVDLLDTSVTGSFSGGISTSASVAGNFGVTVTNTNAGVAASAALRLINDVGGSGSGYIFLGSSNYINYGGPKSLNIFSDITGGTIAFSTQSTKRGYVAANGSLVWGAPTDGSNGGAGSINATAVYDDAVLLTCFAVQYLKYGEVDLAQWDAVAPFGKHEPAHRFVEMTKTFDPRDPAQYISRMMDDEALPGMPKVSEWRHNTLSLGEMLNRLWLAVELLVSAWVGSHKDHERRIAALEARVADLEPKI